MRQSPDLAPPLALIALGAVLLGVVLVGLVRGQPCPEPPRPITAGEVCAVRRAEWGHTEYATVAFAPWGHTRWNDWAGFWHLEGDVLVLTSTGPCCEWRVPLTRGPKGILAGVETRGVDVSLLP